MTTIFYLQKELIILHHRVNVYNMFHRKNPTATSEQYNKYTLGEFSSDPKVLAIWETQFEPDRHIIFRSEVLGTLVSIVYMLMQLLSENTLNFIAKTITNPVADPETPEGGGPRNMKYKPPCAAAIFFWPIFYRPGGGAMAPLAPPWIRYWNRSPTPALLLFDEQPRDHQP